jgi:hypothetical protein
MKLEEKKKNWPPSFLPLPLFLPNKYKGRIYIYKITRRNTLKKKNKNTWAKRIISPIISA